MKKNLSILMLFVVCNFTTVSLCHAQPKLPRGSIPLSIPDDVIEQIEKLYSLSPVDRGNGAANLGKMGKRAIPAIPYLIEMLGDTEKLIWKNTLNRFETNPGGEAARALGEIGGNRVVAPLIAALQSKDTVIRWKVVDALGDIRSTIAVDPLIELLKYEHSWVVRFRIADTLGNIGDSRAIEPLIASLNDKWGTLEQEHAEKALEKMTGEKFGIDPVKWKKWWEDNKGNFKKKAR